MYPIKKATEHLEAYNSKAIEFAQNPKKYIKEYFKEDIWARMLEPTIDSNIENEALKGNRIVTIEIVIKPDFSNYNKCNYNHIWFAIQNESISTVSDYKLRAQHSDFTGMPAEDIEQAEIESFVELLSEFLQNYRDDGYSVTTNDNKISIEW